MKLIKIILIIENRYCDFFIEELGDCEDCILFMLYKIIYFFFLLFICKPPIKYPLSLYL